ncbi:DUF2267 domain-containing protein [Caenispirillum salinarum]|uniref:DUF2267 domain-containing protein n=1 Tax=Caenispirillum salinarum TaxID=859058 RepID=UPI003850C375
MSDTGLDIFDRTVQVSNEWVNEINAQLGGEKKHAYHALRATLHALRDRLTVDEATDLGAQFPIMVKGIYYDQWHPADNPAKDQRSKEEFLGAVGERLKQSATDDDPERACKAVFAVLQQRVTAGEIKDVKNMLPGEVQTLWPN